MAKPFRGELEVELGGEKHTLRLALGDLEELESRTGTGIIALATRFSTGQARISDAHAILRQGFAGAKIKIAEAKLTKLIEDAGLGAVSAAAALLMSVLVDDSEGNAGAAGEEAAGQ